MTSLPKPPCSTREPVHGRVPGTPRSFASSSSSWSRREASSHRAGRRARVPVRCPAGEAAPGAPGEVESGPGVGYELPPDGVQRIGDADALEGAGLEAPAPSGSLDFGFTLADMPEDLTDPAEEVEPEQGVTGIFDEATALTEERTEAPAAEKPSPAVADEWMTPSGSGGLLPVDDAPAQSWREPPADLGEGRGDEDVMPEMESASPTARGGRRGAGILLAGLAAGAVVAGVVLANGGGADGDGQSTAELGPPVPPGLEAGVEDALARFAVGIQAAVDSLRLARGLPEGPSPDWLGGYYLANADEFPQIREFWVGYQAFIGDLRARDRPVLQASPALAAAGTAGALETYVTALFDARTMSRQDHYDQLVFAAAQAVEFHDFLVENGSGLTYTPALVSSLPSDPVLEVDATDPELRGDLNARLDDLLSALDRSRGGSAPGSMGLGQELFSTFGDL